MKESYVYVNNCKYTSVPVGKYEFAWKITDSVFVLDYLLAKERIILGGDILSEKLVHNYDNWYYNPDYSKSLSLNVKESYDLASEYLQQYINRNGNDFYVIFVVE